MPRIIVVVTAALICGLASAGPLQVQALDWPWAWGDEPFELHLIRLRLDAGERRARAYAHVGDLGGTELQLRVALLGPDGAAVWEESAPVAPGTNYALDLELPAPAGHYAVRATLLSDGQQVQTATAEFDTVAHPAAVSPPARASFDLHFSEDDPARTVGPWPVAVGVPFPRGALTSDQHLRVLDPDGNEVPVQVETLVRWYGGREDIRWALLQLQPMLRPGAGPYRLEFGTAVERRAVAPDPALAARAETLARDWLSAGAYLVRDDGSEFLAANDPEATVAIEEAGPLVATVKVAGRYLSDAGDALCRYEARLSCFRDQPAVRIAFTLVWTETAEVGARDVGVRIPAGFAGERVRVGAAAYDLPRRGSVILLQDEWDHYRVAAKSGGALTDRAEGERAPGFIVLEGGGKRTAAFMADMDRNVPTELEATADALVLHLWAGDAGPLSWRVEDVVTAMVREHYGDRVANGFTTGGPLNTNDDTDKSPFGVAKTLEFWMLPADAEGDPEAINALVQSPPVLLADPAWTARTQVWGPSHPYDPERFGEFEESLELVFDWLTMLRPEYGDASWFNWGDVHMGVHGSYVGSEAYSPLAEKYGFSFLDYRGWGCSGYDWPTAVWVQFARTGQRKYFEHALANARHVMDIDTCHETADPATDRSQWGKVRGEQYEYALVHWTFGPIPLTFYTHVDSMCYCWLMTGDRRARDVLGEVAEAARAYWRVQGDREVTNPPKVLCRLYEITGDEQALYMAHRFVQHNVSAHISTSDIYLYPGLFYYWNLTGREEARDLLRYYVDRELPPDPAWDRQPVPERSALEGAGYAYWATGDPKYLRYGEELLRSFADGIQREGPQVMRGMYSGRLPIIELGPRIRGVPAFLAAMAQAGDQVEQAEIGQSALIARPAAEVIERHPGYDQVTRAWLLEERDREFVVGNPFTMTFGDTGGEATMRLISPSGLTVGETTVTAERLREAEDLRLEVPADGETGQYELIVLLKGATSRDVGNSFVRVRTSLERVVYDVAGGFRFIEGPGRIWLHVPAGTEQFTLHFAQHAGGGIVLRDPDGERVTGLSCSLPRQGQYLPTEPMVVDVPAGRSGWWYLSYDSRDWPPLAVSLEGLPPRIALRDVERFVVE